MTQKQFDEHLVLYHGYINKSNKLSSQKRKLLAEGEYYELKTQEALNLNGVILHELYFENIEEYYNYDFSTYKTHDILT